MKRKTLTITAVLFACIGLILGLGISSSLDLSTQSHGAPAISKEAVDLLAKIDEATSEVAAAVKPSVVNISSTTTVRMRETVFPFFSDPFFGDRSRPDNRPRQYKQHGLGSGVIVDGNGYILTNNHVIKDAEEIKVTLSNKKVFKGRVVGKDPKTDLAVVKIDASGLPAIRIGDSDKLQVGMRVLAIGNPFGLNQTVTTGVISATGRANVGIADYEDFIQTDAPINPGNSGGALVNIRGELIGLNTAIISSTGGYQGIGFAIPSNMAKAVMQSLIRDGRIVRGWLGVSVQPVTPDLAKQFELKGDGGVLISDVVAGSPAEEAGLRRGDVIVQFNGREVNDAAELKNIVAGTSPGTKVGIKFVRNGRTVSSQVSIRELPDQAQISSRFDNQLKGVAVHDLTQDAREAFNIPDGVSGVVITGIDESSPAAEALARGDVIREINRKKINSVKDYEAAVSGIKPGQKVLLLIFRKGASLYLTI
jgi:serine protease Do